MPQPINAQSTKEACQRPPATLHATQMPQPFKRTVNQGSLPAPPATLYATQMPQPLKCTVNQGSLPAPPATLHATQMPIKCTVSQGIHSQHLRLHSCFMCPCSHLHAPPRRRPARKQTLEGFPPFVTCSSNCCREGSGRQRVATFAIDAGAGAGAGFSAGAGAGVAVAGPA